MRRSRKSKYDEYDGGALGMAIVLGAILLIFMCAGQSLKYTYLFLKSTFTYARKRISKNAVKILALTAIIALTPLCASLFLKHTQSIFTAARKGTSKTIEFHVKNKDEDVNTLDENGWTPLMHAVNGENVRVIQTLLDLGARDLTAGDGKTTALTLARAHNNQEILSLLDKNKYSDIFDAVQDGTLWNVDALLSFKSDSSKRETVNSERDGKPLLMYAIEKKSEPVINELIRLGANVNARDRNSRTPLMYAIEHTAIPGVIHALIRAGADVNASDLNRRTPLMYAAWSSDNPDIIDILVRAGADVNAWDYSELTPLMYAAAYTKTPDVIHALVDAGARVNALDYSRRTPLQIATSFNKTRGIISALVRAGAKY